MQTTQTNSSQNPEIRRSPEMSVAAQVGRSRYYGIVHNSRNIIANNASIRRALEAERIAYDLDQLDTAQKQIDQPASVADTHEFTLPVEAAVPEQNNYERADDALSRVMGIHNDK